MSMDFQRRVMHTEFRQDPDGVEGRIVAKVLTYNVIDDYDTVFLPGVFRASMDARMPRIVWSHDWAEPLGRWERYLDDDNGLTLVGQLDDFDAVPRSRQAWAQLRSGTIDQFSVGFMPEEAAPMVTDGRDVLGFTRGRLDEASLVLVGAVPGTELLALRSPRQQQREIIIVRTPLDKIEVSPEALAQLLAEVENGDTPAPTALSMLLDAPSEPPQGDDSDADADLASLDQDDEIDPEAGTGADTDDLGADDGQNSTDDGTDTPDPAPAASDEPPAVTEPVTEIDADILSAIAAAEDVLEKL